MPISAQPETANIEIVASAGTYRAVTMTIRDYAGSAVTGWNSGTDTLAVEVWPGDDREALTGTGASAAWLDAPGGIYRIVSAGTHTLTPRKYQIRVKATSGGVTYEIARGVYEVKSAPGTGSNATDPATAPYTTIDDLRTVAPWIDQLQSEHDRAGLAEHQEAARQWFDRIILAAHKWNASRVYEFETSGPYRGWGIGLEEPPKWLTDVLATGTGIQLDPPIKRACALYACYSACMAQVTISEEASQYRIKATEFRKMAGNEAACLTVWVKASTTASTYSIPFRLSSIVRN
jgi:hypothetical protein